MPSSSEEENSEAQEPGCSHWGEDTVTSATSPQSACSRWGKNTTAPILSPEPGCSHLGEDIEAFVPPPDENEEEISFQDDEDQILEGPFSKRIRMRHKEAGQVEKGNSKSINNQNWPCVSINCF